MVLFILLLLDYVLAGQVSVPNRVRPDGIASAGKLLEPCMMHSVTRL
jgi:hypothetical protein